MSDSLESQRKTPSPLVRGVENEDEKTGNGDRVGRWSKFSASRRALCIAPIVIIVVLGLSLGLGLGLGLKRSSPVNSSPSTNNTAPANSTTLPVGTTFDYALGFNVTVAATNASTKFYSLDLQNTPANTIAGLIAAGHFVACYFSAGSIESYRPDASQIPAATIGNVMVGWEDEKWLDVRNQGVRSVMTTRIELAQQKGCQGIDADNIDGYANDSGFDMTEDDAVDYIHFLASQAQSKSLLYGLKNGGDLISRVIDASAWVVNEQCVAFSECDLYAPFVQQGKPVLHIEYTDDQTMQSVNQTFQDTACGAGGETGFSTIIKHMQLDNWVVDCS